MHWLQLIRISNLPTAVANVLAMYLLANQSWGNVSVLLLLLCSSMAFYSSGMALNDVFDAEIDAKQRPQRPIPSGRIRLATASRFGWALMGIGWLAAGAAGWLAGQWVDVAKCIAVATVLATCIYLYDGPLKRTVFAPWVMGMCRFCNLMLGAATAGGNQVGYIFYEFPAIAWWIAASIAGLIAGVTLLAKEETRSQQSRWRIVAASAIIIASLVTLGRSAELGDGNIRVSQWMEATFPWMVIGLSTPILIRLGVCWWNPTASSVMATVIAALRSLIIFDAMICFLARPDQIVYAVAVLALLLPAVWLSKWVSAT